MRLRDLIRPMRPPVPRARLPERVDAVPPFVPYYRARAVDSVARPSPIETLHPRPIRSHLTDDDIESHEARR